MLRVLLIGALLSIGWARPVQPVCRYPLFYNTNRLVTNPEHLADFIDDYLRGEAQYVHTIGVDPTTKFTMDGARLDVNQGTLHFHHYWTASSKESILFGILALVLDGNERAQIFYSQEEALSILATKINEFERFNGTYPGYGGHLPWMFVRSTGVTPTEDGIRWTPSLDNGEMWWPMWVVANQLRDMATETADEELAALATRYENWVELMVDSSMHLFWETSEVDGLPLEGRVRTEAHNENMRNHWSDNTYTGNPNCNPVPGPCFLDDPFEGEMFTMMLYLVNPHLTAEQRQAMWDYKRAKLRRESIRIPVNRQRQWFEGQMGHMFSSHEQWKYIFLPYVDSEYNRRVFENNERIRTHFASAYRGNIGMWAPMTGVVTTNDQDPGYYGNIGINEMAWVNSRHNNFVTPYAAFPMVLINETIGMAWVHNLIKGRKGTNCYGTTEGFDVTGYFASPWVTWDTKITTALSLMGGVHQLAAHYLKQKPWPQNPAMTMYDAFIEIVDKEWGPDTGIFRFPMEGESVDYALPSESIPTIYMDDFTGCPLEESCDGTVHRPFEGVPTTEAPVVTCPPAGTCAECQTTDGAPALLATSSGLLIFIAAFCHLFL